MSPCDVETVIPVVLPYARLPRTTSWSDVSTWMPSPNWVPTLYDVLPSTVRRVPRRKKPVSWSVVEFPVVPKASLPESLASLVSDSTKNPMLALLNAFESATTRRSASTALSPRSPPVRDRLRMVTSLAAMSSSAYCAVAALPRSSRAAPPLVGPRIWTPESCAVMRTLVGRA